MASTGSSTSSGGIGFLGLLTIVFITLKLIGVIAWPWLWVLSPLLIGAALTGVGVLGFGLVMLTIWLLDKGEAARNRKRRAERLARGRSNRYPIRTN